MRIIKPFIAGTIFMVVFGFVDNFVLVFGMDLLQDIIYEPVINGGINNTISDALGVLIAGGVSRLGYHVLGVREDETTATQQFVGIIIGCLIPVLIYALCV